MTKHEALGDVLGVMLGGPKTASDIFGLCRLVDGDGRSLGWWSRRLMRARNLGFVEAVHPDAVYRRRWKLTDSGRLFLLASPSRHFVADFASSAA